MGREERTLPAGSLPLRGSVFERNTQTAPLRLACASIGHCCPYSLRHGLPEGKRIREASAMSGGLPFDHSQFSSLQTASYPKIPDLGQASLAVTPVSLPLARWVRSQAHPV